MKETVNLKLTRKNHYEYTWCSPTAGVNDDPLSHKPNAVEISVYYDAGGANYFSGGSNPKAIYASVTPCQRRDGARSYVLGSGKAMIVERLANYKPSALQRAAELLDEHAPALGAAALADLPKAFAALKALFAPVQSAQPPVLDATMTHPFKVRTGCGHVVIRRMREVTAGVPFTEDTIIEAPNGQPCDACQLQMEREQKEGVAHA